MKAIIIKNLSGEQHIINLDHVLYVDLHKSEISKTHINYSVIIYFDNQDKSIVYSGNSFSNAEEIMQQIYDCMNKKETE